LGTGNVLAYEIGLPRGAQALAQLLAHGAAQPIWPGEIDGHRFLMMAGAGFDAAVLERLNEGWKQRVGKLAFVWAILRAIAAQRPSRYVVECEGERLEAASLVIAKGHFYAGRFVLARAARLDEPRLHLVLFRDGRRVDAVRYLLAMALGFVDRLSGIRILAVDGAVLTGPQGAPVEADGDIVARAPVRIGVAAAPLQLVRPG
jgi:diacylglycerol kinase family enzyme